VPQVRLAAVVGARSALYRCESAPAITEVVAALGVSI
jgi:hypothetical protein